jgi:hypothetical protein
MNYDLAEQISLIAAPIYAALMQRASNIDLQTKSWQQEARAAAIRQAHALWLEALEEE